MANYAFCRVNDHRHGSYERALEDMIGLVRGRRYYTRSRRPPKAMRGTPMIGIGSHGGRGLFVMGICQARAWERLGPEDLPYLHRIDVAWGREIYRADLDAVLEGVTKFNRRAWTSATREDYQLVAGRVRAGEVALRVPE